MKSIKSTNLKGKNRCHTFRKYADIVLEDGKRDLNNYQKTIIVKEAIVESMKHGYNKADCEKRIKEGFDKLSYETDETKRIHCEDAFLQVDRYLTSETRKGTPIVSGHVNCFGLEVNVLCDMYFEGVREWTYVTKEGKKKVETIIKEPYVELVKYRSSKPNVTQSGKKEDASVMGSLELYAMLKYARELAEVSTYKDEPLLHVGASYYFLRKKSDNFKDGKFNPNFFSDKNDNVVTLWETHSILTSYGEPELIDAAFKPQFEAFQAGRKCSDKDCEGCKLYATCHYEKPPVKLAAKKSGRTLSDVVLSDIQEEAVNVRNGIYRLNAGAGSGKTFVISLLIASLLDEGVDPDKILAITFTNNGAKEMADRIKLYTNEFGCDVDVSHLCTTFNGFGDKIIKEFYEEVGYAEVPRLIDNVEKAVIIKDLLQVHYIDGLDYRNFSMSNPYVKGALPLVINCFNAIKANQLGRGQEEELRNAIDYNGISDDTLTEIILLYDEYDDILRDKCLIEYADQENLLIDFISKNPYYFEDNGYEYIIIDEFQDTNAKQMYIIRNLMDNPDFKALMVVGDDSQGIYSFRGGSNEVIVEFDRYMSASKDELNDLIAGKINITDVEKKEGIVKDLFLVENYRCTPEIVKFANNINKMNSFRVEKDLIATRPSGRPVSVKQFWDKKKEKDYIIEQIIKLHKEGFPYESMAFIAYKNSELSAMGTALTEAGIPWISLNPVKYKDDSKVMAVISLARILKDHSATKDAFIWLNAISDNTLLDEKSSEIINKEVNEFIASLEEMNKEDFKDMITELDKGDDEVYTAFKDQVLKKRNVDEMLDWCINFDIYGDGEKVRRTDNYSGIVLTTAHSSKGLEWPVCFVSLSSFQNSLHLSSKAREELRRLFFVSATRARDILYVTGQTVAGYKMDNDGKRYEDYYFLLIDAFKAVGKEADWKSVDPSKEK